MSRTNLEPPGAGARTSALLLVLDEGKEVLERTAARGGQAISLLGLVVSAYVAVVESLSLGLALLAVAAAALGWFTVVVTLSRRPRLARRLAYVTPFVEVTIPTVVLLVIAQIEGQASAVSSWVPPQLYTVVILLSLLRLRAPVPVLMGALAALEYGAFAWFVLQDIGEGAPGTALTVRGQGVRAATLFLAGGLASLVTLAVRRGLDRVAHRAREKDLLGKYRLGEVIAKGGMGTVVKATYCPEGGFERPVAIKRVHSHLAQDRRSVKGFRQEAELCARLLHPNIVSVLDFGSVEDTYFFAMEYVDGLHLGQMIERAESENHPISPALVAFLGRQVAAGLDFAHEKATDGDGHVLHVVHRDLSPNNILVSWGGEVKVSDFGIARVLRDRAGHQTDHLTGKVAYMAPEQAVGESFDQRADLFSLGLVLRELLTGQNLFARSTQAASLLAVLQEPISSLTEVRPDLDPAWAELVDKLLERDPADRPSTAAEVVSKLDEILRLEASKVEAVDASGGVADGETLRAYLERWRPLSSESSSTLRIGPDAADA